MKKNKVRSQKGAISMFAMGAMLFFLVIMVGIYSLVSKRAQSQTESIGLVQNEYYTEGEEVTKYDARIASNDEKIPIYTKEQFWSIGENKAIEIEGKVYDFSSTNYANYELKNDIIINMTTDLKDASFKDNLFYTDQITKNDHEIYYYYEGNYYVPTTYYDGKTTYSLAERKPVLSASGTNLATISATTTGLSGKYYLFGELPKTAENLEIDAYGKVVTNYSCTNSAACNWKIFYVGNDFSVDGESYIYLIADDYISYQYAPAGKKGTALNKGGTNYKLYFTNMVSDYVGSEDITDTKMQALNSSYFNYLKNNNQTSTNNNMKVTAYMLDTSVWSVFAGDKAEYAIGGPTIEIFMKSYSQKHNVDYRAKVSSVIGYQISNNGGANWRDTCGGILDTSDNLYVIKSADKAEALWIASPANNSGNNMLRAGNGGGVIANGYTGGACRFSTTSLLKIRCKITRTIRWNV